MPSVEMIIADVETCKLTVRAGGVIGFIDADKAESVEVGAGALPRG